MRYSVGMRCEGDKVMSADEIVELADAVAIHSGIATGVGQEGYGAQIVVDAENSREAEAMAKEHFRVAVQQAGLPAWPISQVETLSEEDDFAPDM
ncbi:MAG TPA: hypothetical protein VHJ78_11520 [Actinomycetota bacterium]|nr:hypothetical protein [Actinomycetota bacterium]HEX2054339.1 hypothetical protein [Actinomycetota bacterium]